MTGRKKPKPKSVNKKQEVENSIRNIEGKGSRKTLDAVTVDEVAFLRQGIVDKHNNYTSRDMFREVLIDAFEKEKGASIATEEIAQMLQQFGVVASFNPLLDSYVNRVSDVALLKRICHFFGLNPEETQRVLNNEIDNKFRVVPKTPAPTENK